MGAGEAQVTRAKPKDAPKAVEELAASIRGWGAGEGIPGGLVEVAVSQALGSFTFGDPGRGPRYVFKLPPGGAPTSPSLHPSSPHW